MLIAVQAVYQSLLHLTWVDKLIDNIKTIFVDLYKIQLKNQHTTVVECLFDDYFDQQVRELEGETNSVVVESPAFSDEKKDIPINGDTGGPPPPLPGFLKGTFIFVPT